MVHADLERNRTLWTLVNEQYTGDEASVEWAATDIRWGLFGILERDLGALGDPASLSGLDVLEVGCGTAYFSAWLARHGARPVGVDLTRAQLASAQACQQEHGLSFPLVESDGATLPLASASFDLVVSEYGASCWCDPRRWVAEAARVLRPGGRLVFLTNSMLAFLCVPAEAGHAVAALQRPQRGLYEVAWDGGGVEYHPSHSEWIRVLRANGFVVDALHELYAPDDGATHDYYAIATAEWASQWPVEDLWVAHLDR